MDKRNEEYWQDPLFLKPGNILEVTVAMMSCEPLGNSLNGLKRELGRSARTEL